jgi:hypothetical protein
MTIESQLDKLTADLEQVKNMLGSIIPVQEFARLFEMNQISDEALRMRIVIATGIDRDFKVDYGQIHSVERWNVKVTPPIPLAVIAYIAQLNALGAGIRVDGDLV